MLKYCLFFPDSLKSSFILYQDLGSAASKPHGITSDIPALSANEGPALISNDEAMGDDWLIEDIRPTIKRKRLDVDSVFKGTNANKKRRSVGHRVWINEEDDNYHIGNHTNDGDFGDETNWKTLHGTDRMSVVEVDHSGTNISGNYVGTDVSLPVSQSKKSKQLTLTQCARSVERSSRYPQPNQPRMNNNDMTVSPSSASSDVTSAVLRFRVKIKDVTLLVPIQKRLVVCTEEKDFHLFT